MSVQVQEQSYVAPSYGGWRRPRSAGFGKLSFAATVVGFAGLLVAVVALLVGGLLWALGVAAVFGLTVAVTMFEDRDGRNLGHRVATRLMWSRTRRAGAHLYRSGPLGRTDFGRFRPPGLLAQTHLVEGKDSFGRPFSLVHVPAKGHYTLVLNASPGDTFAVHPATADQWVANFGAFLAGLGNEYDVRAAAVTVEAAPDSGETYRAEIAGRRREDAPAFAQAVIDELQQAGAGGAGVRCWVTITFAAAAGPSGKRGPDEMIRDLATRVHHFCQQVAACGPASVRPATGAELCEAVRTAYDPACSVLFDTARADGQDIELGWDEVGPSAAQTSWNSYRHDSGTSVTWAMSGAPSGHVTSGVLRRLLEPMPGVARKRVTLLYQPMDAGTAAQVVERDKHNAINRANGPRPTSRAVADVRAATQAADEEASGAGLVDFAMLVTVTVTDHDLAWATTTIENAAQAARLRLRVVHGSQDSAFAAALPLGVVLPEHVNVPGIVRKAAA